MRRTIPVHEFVTPIFHQWDKGWFLLTSGDFAAGDYNTMTVSWGAMGGLWGRPFVQVVVRPQRYTYGFMERYDTFTLSAFPESYRKALDLLGVKSGRDGDKIAEAGLTAGRINPRGRALLRRSRTGDRVPQDLLGRP